MGYKLEFLGESVYLGIWAAGLGLFGVSCWVLGQLLDGYQPPPQPPHPPHPLSVLD